MNLGSIDSSCFRFCSRLADRRINNDNDHQRNRKGVWLVQDGVRIASIGAVAVRDLLSRLVGEGKLGSEWREVGNLGTKGLNDPC